MTTRQLLLPFLAFLSLAATPCLAQVEKAGEGRTNVNVPDIEPWKELATALPAYPRPEDLVLLESEYFDGSYEYLVDAASLVVGDDGITRYSVVIRKPDGGRQHVIHEGLRCDISSIRIYGMASGGVLRARESDWQRISRDGPYVYRRVLYEDIFCADEGGPLDTKYAKARLHGDADAGFIGGSNSYYTGRR